MRRNGEIEKGELLKVEKLIKDKNPVVTISADAKIRDAIEKMIENDYSQLPVVNDNKVLGIISIESIVRLLFHGDGKTNVLELPVQTALPKPKFIKLKDDIFDSLNQLANEAFVLVGNEKHLEGIVTNYDVVYLFHDIADPYVIIRDIELRIRKIIITTLESEMSLQKAIENAFGYLRKCGREKEIPKGVDDMTFDHYKKLILSKKNWPKFESQFNDRRLAEELLEATRELRNQALHFRGPLAKTDLDKLHFVRQYLERK
jgi:CBS domain-containing protein